MERKQRADQVCGFLPADLRLCFLIFKNQIFSNNVKLKQINLHILNLRRVRGHGFAQGMASHTYMIWRQK